VITLPKVEPSNKGEAPMNNQPTMAPQTSLFTRQEQVRLTAYKQAVQAGLYSETSDCAEEPAYHFSPAELLRLSCYKAAVQAGFYHEGR
jgi:hypothetical protein